MFRVSVRLVPSRMGGVAIPDRPQEMMVRCIFPAVNGSIARVWCGRMVLSAFSALLSPIGARIVKVRQEQRHSARSGEERGRIIR